MDAQITPTVLSWNMIETGWYESVGGEHHQFQIKHSKKAKVWLLARRDPSGRFIIVGSGKRLKDCQRRAQDQEVSL